MKPVTAGCRLTQSSLVSTAMLVGCVASSPPTLMVPPVDDAHSYLTGAQIGERVLGNVAVINAGGQRGMGFIVGATADAVMLATAAHVVVDTDEPAAGIFPRPRTGADISVRFCAPGYEQKIIIGQRVALDLPHSKDLALVSVPLVGTPPPETQVLADHTSLRKGDQAWIVGRAGECRVSGVAGNEAGEKAGNVIDAVSPDAQGEIVVFAPGGVQSSSGAPLISGRGIVGVVQVDATGGFLKAESIETLRQAVARSPMRISWWLELSKNVPPMTPEAARTELSEALTRYLFVARTAQIVLSKERLNSGELGPTIENYNGAIRNFFAVMNKHDGTLARRWNPSLLTPYRELRDRLLEVHFVFLDLTRDGYVSAMYRDRAAATPAEVRERMSRVAPKLIALERDIERFNHSLATGETS